MLRRSQELIGQVVLRYRLALETGLRASEIRCLVASNFKGLNALRHQFCSHLVRSGVNIKVAQTLARHSTVELTIGRYGHAHMEDQASAVAALPDLTASQRPAKRPPDSILP